MSTAFFCTKTSIVFFKIAVDMVAPTPAVPPAPTPPATRYTFETPSAITAIESPASSEASSSTSAVMVLCPTVTGITPEIPAVPPNPIAIATVKAQFSPRASTRILPWLVFSEARLPTRVFEVCPNTLTTTVPPTPAVEAPEAAIPMSSIHTL